MPPVTAVLDACVIYPATLRDFLMHLAVAGLYEARWTDHIHDEWIRNVLADRPDLTADRLVYTRGRMDAAVPGGLVTGYEDLIDALVLPDPDDRHVLAAAVRAVAGVIVTLNLKDFPAVVLAGHGVEAKHPDEFAVELVRGRPDAVIEVARTHRAALKNPPKAADEYLGSLAAVGLPRTAAALAGFKDRL